MNSVIINKANLSEFDSFYTFFEKTLNEGYFIYSPKIIEMIKLDLPKNNIRDGIKKGKRILYLSYFNNKVNGYLLTNKMDGGVAFGHWLAVDRTYQKKGVASALLKFWEKDSISNGAHMIELYTTKNNIEFYINNGFFLAEGVPGSWFGEDHYHFYKILRRFNEDQYFKNNKYMEKKKASS